MKKMRTLDSEEEIYCYTKKEQWKLFIFSCLMYVFAFYIGLELGRN